MLARTVLWPGLIFLFIILEICLRLINHHITRVSIGQRSYLSQKFNNLSNSSSEPNVTHADLTKLSYEYNEHVKRCVVHYGSWSNAIISEESMHMPDYRGQFLNVVSGLRVTTDNPTVSHKKITVFGGSTVFCGEVPDSLTSCSHLQSIINEHKVSATVINYGRHGSTMQNRLSYLENSEFNNHDIVLFWFGVNELGWKSMEGKTKTVLITYLLNRVSEGLEFVSKYLALFTFSSRIFDSAIRIPVFRLNAYRVLKRTLVKIKKLSHLRGFEYRLFLQPNLFTKTAHTHREFIMSELILSSHSGKITKKLLDVNYPKFRNLLYRANGTDASDVFQKSNREVFVDWCHLNSEGNRVVAQFIFDEIIKNNMLEVH